MTKYKRKHKKNRTFLIGITIISVLILITTGYSLWTDTLNIQGTIVTNYQEPKLENITVNQTSSKYISISESYFIKAITLNTTSINNSTIMEIVANLKVKSYTLTSRTVTVSASFVNNYGYNMTNGQVSVYENTTGLTVSSSSITQTVSSGGTSNFSTQFDISSNIGTKVLRYRISYVVDEVPRYFYITLNFS